MCGYIVLKRCYCVWLQPKFYDPTLNFLFNGWIQSGNLGYLKFLELTNLGIFRTIKFIL